jgi:hypothetical protein
MTYAELVQKIRDYTETDSNVLTATIVDGFIEDAEFRIFRDVDSDNNKRYATANLIASQRFIDVPADLLVVRSAQIVDGGSGSTRNFLEFRDTSFMSEYNSTGVTGEPKYYGMWDQNTIVLAPTPSSTYEIQLNLNKWEDEDEMNINQVFLESEANKEITYGYNTSDRKCF